MKLLLIRFSSLGDVVLTTPLVRVLRARCPDAEIHFATRPAFVPLLESSPRLDRILALPGGDAASLRAFAATLRAERYDRILDLHGTLRARVLCALVPRPRWSRFDKATLRRWALVHLKLGRNAPAVPVVDRYFGAARDLGLTPDGGPPEAFVTPDAAARADAALAAAGIAPTDRLVAIAPGARHATKCWPEDRWAELARRLVARGERPVLVGGPEDAALAGRIAAASPGAVSVAGGLDVLASCGVLARCLAVASGDTGVMHLATAVGSPVVALFGPTSRGLGFFPCSPTATVIERDLPCRPCSTHGGATCPLGHHDCLQGITVDEVASALARAVGDSGAVPTVTGHGPAGTAGEPADPADPARRSGGVR